MKKIKYYSSLTNLIYFVFFNKTTSMSSIKISGLKIKTKTNKYKKVRKSNYKKKVVQEAECCICFGFVAKSSDNTVYCGKSPHTICGGCKIQMKDSSCPMCRSHPLKMPVAQDVFLKKVKRQEKPWSNDPQDISRASRKQKRNYRRKGPYEEDFGPQTNRLVRQKKNSKGLTARNYILNQSMAYVERCDIEVIDEQEWLTREQVLAYNGSIRTEYDTFSEASDSSEDDTLSLTSDVSEGTIVRILFEDDD